MKYIAHDTETTLIGIDNVIPDIICSSWYNLHSKDSWVSHWSPPEPHVSYFKSLVEDEEQHIIYHNASFDLGVLTKYDQSLLSSIWDALKDNRIHDTMIREMLLNLTLAGSIDMIEQHGLKINVSYSLASLVKQYLDIDITEEKEAEDSVRTNYAAVRYKPLNEWPKEYVEYAEKDAEYTGLIFLAQEQRRQKCIEDTGYDPFVKEGFIVMSSLSLYFMTAQGNLLDKERVASVTEEFLTMYTDPELTWPLIHSAWIQEFRINNPDVRQSQLIKKAKEAFEKSGISEASYKDTGILKPAISSMPYAKGTKEHLDTCEGHKEHPEYSKSKKIQCDCPVKMKKGKPESISKINLHQYVWDLAKSNPDIKLWLSDKFKENMKDAGLDVPHPLPQDFIEENAEIPFIQFDKSSKPKRMSLKVDKTWLASFGGTDPVIAKYAERQKIQKIVSSYLPCMYWAPGYKTGSPMLLDGASDKFEGKEIPDRVHAQFAPLKETGRTSSYASKKGKGNNAKVLYPSWNGQQVDPRIRQCVIPSEGNVLFSIDYSAMELGTAAQVAYNLLGYEGVLMKLINQGVDTHVYLGAQIAIKLDPEFTSAWGMDEDDPMLCYNMLKGVAKNKEVCDSPVFREIFEDCYLGKDWAGHTVTWDDCLMSLYYKHFRTFGKPTGLGFWGGLGEATFATMARGTYGIFVDIPTAKTLRQVWRKYIPEGQEYLNHINKHMIDPMAQPEIVQDEKGKNRKRNFYCYDTPLGMHRAKCSYTAAANGCALQSPSAEGALMAVNEIMQECTIGSLAGYVFPSIFIHDEVFGEAIYDDSITSRIQYMQKIMKDSMEVITPNVKANAEACIMNRWDKRADTVFDGDKLVPWEPKEK